MKRIVALNIQIKIKKPPKAESRWRLKGRVNALEVNALLLFQQREY